MSDLDTLRAVHTAAAMQADHVADLWRVVRAGVQDALLPCNLRYPHDEHVSTCDMDISQSKIARALGISRQRVGQLAAEPVDEDAREAWANLRKGTQ